MDQRKKERSQRDHLEYLKDDKDDKNSSIYILAYNEQFIYSLSFSEEPQFQYHAR